MQYWLRSEPYWQLVRARRSGSTRANLNARVLEEFPLLVPDLHSAFQFREIVGALREKVVANVADLGRKVYLSWDKILKYELIERWDIAKIFFESLFLALVYFVTSTVIVNYQSQIISAEVMILSGVIAFSFIVLLTAIDLIRGERIRSTFY